MHLTATVGTPRRLLFSWLQFSKLTCTLYLPSICTFLYFILNNVVSILILLSISLSYQYSNAIYLIRGNVTYPKLMNKKLGVVAHSVLVKKSANDDSNGFICVRKLYIPWKDRMSQDVKL